MIPPHRETVLITGCRDGGIGSALAILFQKEGFNVFASDRDPSKMSLLKDLKNVVLLTLDVTKSEDIKAAADTISEQTNGALDYLIHNAGRYHSMPILDENLNTVRSLFETNLMGPIALTQKFSPLLINRGGMVAFITSTAGYLNIPYMGTYAASKRCLGVVADTLRLELSPFYVDVLEVVTGRVESNGQTYVDDFKLPEDSLYKDIESVVGTRAQGGGGMPTIDTIKYAKVVIAEILKHTSGRLWVGQDAQGVGMVTTSASVKQADMDALAKTGTDLEKLSPGGGGG